MTPRDRSAMFHPFSSRVSDCGVVLDCWYGTEKEQSAQVSDAHATAVFRWGIFWSRFETVLVERRGAPHRHSLHCCVPATSARNNLELSAPAEGRDVPCGYCGRIILQPPSPPDVPLLRALFLWPPFGETDGVSIIVNGPIVLI